MRYSSVLPQSANPAANISALPSISTAVYTNPCVYGHAESLTLDIPESLVDPGDGAHQHAAAPVEAGAVDGAPQVLNPVGIAIDFHGRVHKPMAKILAKKLEEFDPMFIEEPVLCENMEYFPVLQQR